MDNKCNGFYCPTCKSEGCPRLAAAKEHVAKKPPIDEYDAYDSKNEMYAQLGKCVFEVIDRMGDLTGGDEAIQLCLELVELTNPIFNKYLPIKTPASGTSPQPGPIDEKIGYLMRSFLEHATRNRTNFDTWEFARAVAAAVFVICADRPSIGSKVEPCTCFDEPAKKYCMRKNCSKIEAQSKGR